MRFLKYALIALLAVPALADESSWHEVKLHPEISTTPGWNLLFKLGVDNPNFNFSRFVPGIDNSTLIHLGGSAMVGLTYVQGQHEWRNKLSLAVGYNLDQFVSDFVKARDYLRFDSTYYLSFNEGVWGLFGRFTLDTAMFPGLDIQPEDSPTNYEVYNSSGVRDPTQDVRNATRFTLTNAFSPLILTENVGVFARPMTWRWISWEVLAGMYFNQGFTDGKRVIDDVVDGPGPDETTTNVFTLENYFQVGAGIGNNFWGVISDQFNYVASFNVFYAFFDKGSVRDLPSTFANNISMDAGIGLVYQPLTWLGIAWEGHAKYQPYVTDEFQLDSFFNLNFSFNM